VDGLTCVANMAYTLAIYTHRRQTGRDWRAVGKGGRVGLVGVRPLQSGILRHPARGPAMRGVQVSAITAVLRVRPYDQQSVPGTLRRVAFPKCRYPRVTYTAIGRPRSNTAKR
jgi:hypothetical protein